MKRVAVLLAVAALAGCLTSDERGFVLGTTTTTQDSGLLDVLLPAFEQDTGLHVRAVVGGTGEIHEKAKRGDVDVLLTHAPDRERALVADGWAIARTPVMFNRFLVAGPASDPAGAANATSAPDVLARIAANGSLFASRGDASGTHEKELALWRAAGIDPATLDPAWHKETGAGQGQTLLYAAERGAYLLVDEGTLLAFRSEGKATATVPLFDGDPVLRNEYSVLLLDPQRIPGVDTDGPRAFTAWLASPRGQEAIASVTLDGKPLFTPIAEGPAS